MSNEIGKIGSFDLDGNVNEIGKTKGNEMSNEIEKIKNWEWPSDCSDSKTEKA